MEVLAENSFTITKKLSYEGLLRISAEDYGKFAKKAVLFLAAAWLVLAIFTLWQGQGIGYIVIEFVILCLVSLWISVYVPRNKAKRAFKALEARYGSDLQRTIRFYEDRLEVTTPETQKTVPYSEITQVLHSKNLLILVTEDRSGILVALDSFTLGSDDTVQDLIRDAKAKTPDY